ncbi:MAG: alkaline phosphatase PhoX [Gammaproteobacteria bacterium]
MTRNTPTGLGRGLTRRQLLGAGVRGAAYLALARALVGCSSGGSGRASAGARLATIGPLAQSADVPGVRVPPGFSARVIAQANRVVPGTSLLWHTDPDGAATYKTDDGGWIYVSNREFMPGGVNALRFDAQGEVVDGYNVLPGALTRINCGGGITPWSTWLSGEEYDLGLLWECDPFGAAQPQPHPALGMFSHEAAAVDPRTNYVYETEDKGDSRFYRFVPDAPNVGGRPDLSSGTLQVMKVLATQEATDTPGLLGPLAVEWIDVPNPTPIDLSIIPLPLSQVTDALAGVLPAFTATRHQVPESTAFDGGEGIWYHEGLIYFTTKGDRRVWAHDPVAQTVECIYDDALYAEPVLDSVDNIVVTPGGDLIIVEDKSEANQQAVALTAGGGIVPLIELVGDEGSEVTGPAFSPDGRHFYFSSQRGPGANGTPGIGGITYCVSGPWFAP